MSDSQWERGMSGRRRTWFRYLAVIGVLLPLACTDDDAAEEGEGRDSTDTEADASAQGVPSSVLDAGAGDALEPPDAGGGESTADAATVPAPDANTAIGVSPGCAPSATSPFVHCVGQSLGSPVIEDFEAGDYATVARQNVWFEYDDGSDGSLQAEVEEDGDSSVLHVVSTDWTIWGAGMGTLLHAPQSCDDYCIIDGSDFRGVQFRARGSGRLRLRLATSQYTPVDEGGACELSGESCYDWPGANVDLSPDWQTFSLPFCRLTPEGWGISSADFQLEPAHLVGLHLRFDNSQPFELWLDDVSFYGDADGGEEVDAGDQGADAGSDECRQPCPLEAAPKDAIIEPEDTSLALSDELSLHVFEQETTGDCGSLTRRYLSYVPSYFEPSSDAPILFALHGSGANAETTQELQARGGLDELAEREGFVVVYGNAAPGAYTDASPYVPNSGAWRQDSYDDGQVDDVEYLRLVLGDLAARGVTSGDNAVYLTGLSNGGGMVLAAARRAPELFSGIAPFMPFVGWSPASVPDLSGTPLQRVLFAYAPDDPGLPPAYTPVLEEQAAAWAQALGIPQSVIDEPVVVELPDVVEEGSDYEGDSAAALATRDSRVVQLDMSDPETGAELRVLRFDRAGHFWPNPVQDEADWVLDRWGFRNQDVDASIAVWEFLLQQ